MRKLIFILLLFSIIPLQLFCDSDETAYLLSDTSKGLYDTGESTMNTALIIIGEHLNTAISPTVFYNYGFGSDSIKNVPLGKLGTLIFETKNIVSYLLPSVPNPADTPGDLTSSNFMLRGDFNILYPFKIPCSIKKLSFTISPYLQFYYQFALHMKITNIMLQSFASLNLGGKFEAQFEIFRTLRVGANFASFLIGMDLGRNGYNKEFINDLVFAHFGNYLDLNLAVFCEWDISRTESVRLSYLHDANSYFGGENYIINGEHQLGLSYTGKLIR